MEHILVIDDNEDIVNSVSKVLTHLGYDVKVAHDGEEGIELFNRGFNFDCVITDINMPRVNGVEVAQYIRNSDKSEIPVIAITGFYEGEIDKEMIDKKFNLIEAEIKDEEKLLKNRIAKIKPKKARQNVEVFFADYVPTGRYLKEDVERVIKEIVELS